MNTTTISPGQWFGGDDPHRQEIVNKVGVPAAGTAGMALFALTRRSLLGKLLFAIPAVMMGRRALAAAREEGLIKPATQATGTQPQPSTQQTPTHVTSWSGGPDTAERTDMAGDFGRSEAALSGTDLEAEAELEGSGYGPLIAAGSDVAAETDMAGDLGFEEPKTKPEQQ